jgi:hypothetical protein
VLLCRAYGILPGDFFAELIIQVIFRRFAGLSGEMVRARYSTARTQERSPLGQMRRVDTGAYGAGL